MSLKFKEGFVFQRREAEIWSCNHVLSFISNISIKITFHFYVVYVVLKNAHKVTT